MVLFGHCSLVLILIVLYNQIALLLLGFEVLLDEILVLLVLIQQIESQQHILCCFISALILLRNVVDQLVLGLLNPFVFFGYFLFVEGFSERHIFQVFIITQFFV